MKKLWWGVNYVEICRLDKLSVDGANLVRDAETNSLSRVFSVLRNTDFLEEALQVFIMLFRFFGKNVLGTVQILLRNVLRDTEVDEEDTEV